MFDQPMAFVDIETNGEMGARGRIIEIAVIRVENGDVTETFSSLINPGGTIPVWIERLTGITNADASTAPYFEDIADQLLTLLEGAIFVAHNVRFDYSFVKAHFEAIGHAYRPKLFCTVRLSRALYPEHKGHSLEKIISRHGIDATSRHRALGDVLATLQFVRLSLNERGEEAFKANFALQLRTKILPPHVDTSILSSLPEKPGIYIFKDADGSPLYVGKSINIQNRVRSHFTSDTKIVKEMQLAQRSYSIDFIETTTEVEALLLESSTVKSLQPLFNRKLRKTTTQFALVQTLSSDGYSVLSVESRSISELKITANIYGFYATRQKAKAALEKASTAFDLCPKLLGLEAGKGACFRYQLGLCKGACTGTEKAERYNARVDLAFDRTRVASWPFAESIAIKVSDLRSLIVNQWIIEGIVHHEFEPTLEKLSNGFDIDTYKILRSFIRSHPANISKLSTTAFEEALYT